MKAQNVDYVKDSYLEGIQFIKDETTDELFENPSLVPQITRRNTATDSTKLSTTP